MAYLTKHLCWEREREREREREMYLSLSLFFIFLSKEDLSLYQKFLDMLYYRKKLDKRDTKIFSQYLKLWFGKKREDKVNFWRKNEAHCNQGKKHAQTKYDIHSISKDSLSAKMLFSKNMPQFLRMQLNFCWVWLKFQI